MARRPHGTGRIYLRGKLWWIKYYRDGKPVYESSKSEKRTAAEKLLKVRLGDEATGRAIAPGKVSISALCKLVVSDYVITKKRSLYDLEKRVKKHLDPILGSVLASKLDPGVIEGYITKRRSQKASDSTINRELSIVRRGFSLALRQRPPLVTFPPYIPKLEEDNARQGFLEPQSYEKVLNAMPHQLKALFAVAYRTGMRLGELRKLEWSMVDLAAKTITIPVRNAKNKTARIVPIYGDMMKWLRYQRFTNHIGFKVKWVFFWNNRAIGAYPKGWVEAVTKAGFPALRPHDLRRSAVRNMDRAGMGRDTAMAISGHKTQSVFSRYNIKNANDMSAAGKLMEDFDKERAGTVAKRGRKGDNGKHE